VQHPYAGDRGWEVAFEPGLEQLCQDISEANARRLVACWNACEGISTEALEGDDAPRKLREDRDLLLAQRDELLAQLKKVREVIAAWNQAFVETVTNQSTGLIDDPEDILIAEADQDFLNDIDAAIAKTTGGES
jgi:hypothetical protein